MLKEIERLLSKIAKRSINALEWRCENRRLKSDVRHLQLKIEDLKERKKKGLETDLGINVSFIVEQCFCVLKFE